MQNTVLKKKKSTSKIRTSIKLFPKKRFERKKKKKHAHYDLTMMVRPGD